MKKRIIVGITSALFFLFANLGIGYTVSVGDAAPEGTFSRRQIESACAHASAVLEEISGGMSCCASPKLVPRVTLCYTGDEKALFDAILTQTYGVQKACAVYAGGTYLGKCQDQAQLEQALHAFIYDQMPLCAARGKYSRSYTLKTVYTAMGELTPTDDMVLLVSGRSPVMYYTADGKHA